MAPPKTFLVSTANGNDAGKPQLTVKEPPYIRGTANPGLIVETVEGIAFLLVATAPGQFTDRSPPRRLL